MSAIKANCGIELTIDACLSSLAKGANERRLLDPRVMQKSPSFLRNASPQGIRARSPSWINLTAYGEPSCIAPPALTPAPASTDAAFPILLNSRRRLLEWRQVSRFKTKALCTAIYVQCSCLGVHLPPASQQLRDHLKT